ncbi:DNA repair protein rhp42 [Rhizoctonia solani AG-1 IA]|uniref:DNA repair protein rhp42 n=1 Tax=Thanatephorus cucumeris (strain AG1-IA) TaxID=983506 RepID=L8X4J5_THACA|nr:DNA repair protein rhp42 [Rhizoctonia solani AG-1 IA]
MESTDEEDFWDEVEVPQPVSYTVAETIEIPLTETEPRQPLDYDIEVTITKKGASTNEQQAEAIASVTSSFNTSIIGALKHGFTSITKSAHPDPARRGRLFETALVRLVSWFAPSSRATTQNLYVERPSDGWFRITNPGHIKSHTFEAGMRRIQVLEKREAERKARRAKRQERRAKRARARIKGKGKARDVSSSSSDDNEDQDLDVGDSEDEWYAPERLRSPNSISKHALQRSGSRDMAALVFVAIVRALGIPARLVSSLQCVPWALPKDYASKARKPKDKTTVTSKRDDQDTAVDEDAMPGVSSRVGSPNSTGANSVLSATAYHTDRSADHSDNPTRLKPSIKRKRGPGTGNNPISMIEGNQVGRRDQAVDRGTGSKAKAIRPRDAVNHDLPTASPSRPTIKLRRARPAGHVLGTAPSPGGANTSGNDKQSDVTNAHMMTGPPTLWAEVFSRPDGRWIPVDPVRGFVNRAGLFERRDQAGKRKAEKLMYVVAMEEDGYARDVTARYAKNFGAHQARARARIAAGRKNGKVEWWDSVMRVLKRPYALHRDDVEDAELSHQRALEGLPSSISAFKDHPIYALERHLRRDEAIHPRTEIAHFRGEPVFPRRNVLSLKPAEGWMRQGRVLRSGMQPIKMVKARASTIRKKRELEVRREDEGEVMVGMYAEWQTELYKSPPVIDYDHIQGKIPTNDFGNIDLYVPTMLPEGAVHIPRKYTWMDTGFEFRNRQATPIITGIVIAAGNEQVFLEALASHIRLEQAKEATKRRERVLQRWTRLVQGLRIVQRVNEQYSGDNRPGIDENASADGEEVVVSLMKHFDLPPEPGGFLDDLKDVVRPYNLPQAQPIVPKLITEEEDRGVSELMMPQELLHGMPDSPSRYTWSALMEDDERHDEHAELESPTELMSRDTTNMEPPLTMQELADKLSRAREQGNSEPTNGETEVIPDATTPPLPEMESDRHVTKASPEDNDAKPNPIDNRSEANQNNTGKTTRQLRRSSRRHNALSTTPAPATPTPTRTLRPRRKP